MELVFDKKHKEKNRNNPVLGHVPEGLGVAANVIAINVVSIKNDQKQVEIIAHAHSMQNEHFHGNGHSLINAVLPSIPVIPKELISVNSSTSNMTMHDQFITADNEDSFDEVNNDFGEGTKGHRTPRKPHKWVSEIEQNVQATNANGYALPEQKTKDIASNNGPTHNYALPMKNTMDNNMTIEGMTGDDV